MNNTRNNVCDPLTPHTPQEKGSAFSCVCAPGGEHTEHNQHHGNGASAECIDVRLIAIGDGPPAPIRFRKALKYLLREHRLRATWIPPENHER